MKPVLLITINMDDEVYPTIDKMKEIYLRGEMDKEELIKNVKVTVFDHLQINVVVDDKVQEAQIESTIQERRKRGWLKRWFHT